MKILLALLTAGILTLGTFLVAQPQKLGNFNPTGGGTYYLQASINSSQSTITLTSFTEPTSGIPYTMSYLNTDILYATINPTSANSEFVSFTGITQNTNGTALLTGVTRGLGRSYPYAASTTLAHSAPGQTQFILSAPPEFYNEYASKRNTQVISGQWQFTTLPTSTVTCTINTQFCNKGYIDAGLNQGAATSTETNIGLVELATNTEIAAGTASSSAGGPLVTPSKYFKSSQASCNTIACIPVAVAGKLSQLFLDLTQAFTWTGAHIFNSTVTLNATTTATANTLDFNGMHTFLASTTIAAGKAVYMATSTGAMQIADPGASITAYFDGFAKTAATNGNSIVVQRDGIVTGLSGLATSTVYYIDTAGALTAAPGGFAVQVGVAISATSLLIQKSELNYVDTITLVGASGTLTGCNAVGGINGPYKQIVMVSGMTNTTYQAVGDVVLTPFGKNSGTVAVKASSSGTTNTTVTGAVSGQSISVSGSGTSDTTHNYTCSGTAYVYR